MRLLLCGGGTAGHINPAIAVAEELKAGYPDAEILFVGRDGGAENELVRKAGFSLKTIKIKGLMRSFSIENLKRVNLAIRARGEAKKIIHEFRPDVILGTGGYVCWPVISVGQRMKIPTAIHESNTVPGLTSKLLARGSDIVFINREETKAYFSKSTKTITVGNPLRKGFKTISRSAARRKLGVGERDFLIISFGGSIGAKRLNDTLISVMEGYSAKDKSIKHIHATGERYFNEVTSEYKKHEISGCKILPFINDMPTVLSAADVVICRSGAMTLSELSEVGVASILIPSPNVSDNHQYKNAVYLEKRRAATVIEEKNLSLKRLISAINVIKNDKNERKNKAKNINALSTPNSAKIIVNELILTIIGKK